MTVCNAHVRVSKGVIQFVWRDYASMTRCAHSHCQCVCLCVLVERVCLNDA
jgi:hypothetical protein